MTTTSDLSYEDRLKDLSNEDLLKVADRLLQIKNISEFSCNQKRNRLLIQFSRLLGNTYKRCFFEKKKLPLVLDLDHTLLHSVRICTVLKDDQDYLNKKAIVVSSDNDIKGLGSSGDNLYNYRGMYTKLRPHTRDFLKQLSDRFEVFVYTLGTRAYARNMCRLLDPEGVFFKSIKSRDDSTFEDRKNLDILAGPDEKNTIIIDDNKYVWEEHNNNLIEIDEYKFFTNDKGHILKKGEEEVGFDDKDEALKSISEVLQGVHKNFFELFPVPQTDVELQEYTKSVDVRPILKAYRK
ncbi:RNA polymerase II C-terminal domain phosphatase-like 4 [Papaver somniferum]|uniref:RNA polymerase II C-terminal domain phosphatase-like 4 n=1 Tax=Papaver somniferum TaxID=3469 RepID=UPI000E702C28|nr:RNA polymerase II C-terminal domain phosphatase-like 4 [Papaver somniferum]